ncbi:hypothetical protein [Zavarzinella formosa]|uniref:hypothetical protein n=1 Tax=Zavarzinella formosa TaxID=360055 RepID=UPI00031F1BD6|nr:hypothetical protein [Zavarzinella formosa]
MALDTFIAGKYDGTYDAVAVGITDQGFELEQNSSAEMIEESDAYGATLIDWIYRGGSVNLQFLCKAYKAGSITPFWPWGALGVHSTVVAPISRLASDVATAVVLTATADTPAETAPASLTGSLAILAPNSPAKLLFNSKLRQVPVRLQLLPDVDDGTVSWFTIT